MKKAIVDVVRAYALLLPIVAWLLQGLALPSWLPFVVLFLGIVCTYCIAENEGFTQGAMYGLLIACEGALVAFLGAKHEVNATYDHFVLCATFIQLAIIMLFSMMRDKNKR